jgi:hypothetical protein
MLILLNHLRLPSQGTPSIPIQPALYLRYISSGRTNRKDRFLTIPLLFTSPLHRNGSSSIFACLFISAGNCLQSRCLAMNVYSGSPIPAFRRHVTISLLETAIKLGFPDHRNSDLLSALGEAELVSYAMMLYIFCR